MSTSGRRRIRPKADHAAVNAQACAHPGVWVRVREYSSRGVAQGVANRIDGTYNDFVTAPYQPAGHFQTEIRMTEFGTEVWVKYEGPEITPTPRPRRERKTALPARNTRAPYTSHQHVARTAMANPRTWVLVNSYKTLKAAYSIRYYISQTYTPGGHFISECRPADGRVEVWVMYTGPTEKKGMT